MKGSRRAWAGYSTGGGGGGRLSTLSSATAESPSGALDRDEVSVAGVVAAGCCDGAGVGAGVAGAGCAGA